MPPLSRYLLPLLALFWLAGCSPEASRRRQLKRFAAETQAQAPVPPADTLAGAYPASEELDVLDALLHKYPGKQFVRTVTRVETKELPGKTVYVEVPVRADKAAAARNTRERDSLLHALEALVARERADAEIRAEVARLRVGVLAAFNARACLPDTAVRFAKYNLTLEIRRGAGGRYGFTWREGPQQIAYEAAVTERRHARVAQAPAPPRWRDEWFWLALAGFALAGWLGYLRLRDAAPNA